ncbi:MAG: hypothetical protein HUU38_28675 [Anaerolineales bacterium]|jgi:hypothetical protein|nr:hypothetical protein [Anaerolineales bacterium]
MNIFQLIRDRIAAVIGVVFFSILICFCGIAFTFFFAPQQAIEATRISNLPYMDAGTVTSAAPGTDLLVTAWLAGNAPLVEADAFVAYTLETWDVTPGTSSDEGETEPNGTWETVEQVIPDLTLDLNGQTVHLLSAPSVSFSGPLHEQVVRGNGVEEAQYDGAWLPEGSQRYRGFFDGDLLTVLGKKASTGGIIPEKMFAGDRVAFEQSEKDTAKGLLIAGISMMVCAPIFLVLGGLGAIFGRARGRGGFSRRF